MRTFFDYSSEVEQAIKQKKPILALESTLITHGLPFPHNLETAIAIEQLVRTQDVTPATIAIMKGKIKIGLSSQELELLVHDKHVIKASVRDIPYVINKRLTASATVATVLYCADYAGIRVFATGGIGGVHRGNHFDVSADLIELAKTPIAVVASGAKAILDLPKTMEWMETHSIPVIGYRTAHLPAFYSAKTNYRLPIQIDDMAELASLLKIHWQLGLSSGMLIANPIPIENEIPADTIEPAIISALEQAGQNNIHGKAITPYLLETVSALTQGKSLEANIHLIKNNVRVGAELVRALAES